ncbi:MAG: hypothetical protein IJ328_05935 [Muribaculaceae bacterium]|nr:hypothetical protein [Muribaculaceae bacterium]
MKRVLAILMVLCCVVVVNAQEENELKRFAGGFELGGDFGSKNYGLHIGATMRYGHYKNLFNLTAGINFNLNQSYHGREDVLKEYTRAVTLGGQLAIPVVAKFNILKCTEQARFYAGAGAEAAFTIYTKDVVVGIGNKTDSMINNYTTATLVQVGVTGARFDAGIYYKHYLNDLVNSKFPSYQENSRIGVSLAYYF